MTKERWKIVLDQYKQLVELPIERIQRMHEDWQQERETCGCSETAADMIETIFIIALYEATKRDLA